MGTTKCVDSGFGDGESECEVSFGLVPGTELIFELSAKFGVGRSKPGVPEPIYPEIKGRCVFFGHGEWQYESFCLSLICSFAWRTSITVSRHWKTFDSLAKLGSRSP